MIKKNLKFPSLNFPLQRNEDFQVEVKDNQEEDEEDDEEEEEEEELLIINLIQKLKQAKSIEIEENKKQMKEKIIQESLSKYRLYMKKEIDKMKKKWIDEGEKIIISFTENDELAKQYLQEVEEIESEKAQFIERTQTKWSEITGQINQFKKEYEEYEESEGNEIQAEMSQCETQIKDRLKEMKNNMRLIKVESNESKYHQLIRALLMEDML